MKNIRVYANATNLVYSVIPKRKITALTSTYETSLYMNFALYVKEKKPNSIHTNTAN